MNLKNSIALLLAVACTTFRSPPALEVGRMTGGIAASMYAFRMFRDGRVELELYGRRLTATVARSRIDAVLRLAEADPLWPELRAAKQAGLASQDAEPGAIWVNLNGQEVSFNPRIDTIAWNADKMPDLIVHENVPPSIRPLLATVKLLCREAIGECRFYEFVP